MVAFDADPMESVGSASAFGSRLSSTDRLAASPALSSASSAALGGGRVSLAAAEALDLLLDGCLPQSSALQPRLAQSRTRPCRRPARRRTRSVAARPPPPGRCASSSPPTAAPTSPRSRPPRRLSRPSRSSRGSPNSRTSRATSL